MDSHYLFSSSGWEFDLENSAAFKIAKQKKR